MMSVDWDAVYSCLRECFKASDTAVSNVPHLRLVDINLFNYPPRVEIDFYFKTDHPLKAEYYGNGVSQDENPSDETVGAASEWVAQYVESWFPDCCARRDYRAPKAIFRFTVKPKNYEAYGKNEVEVQRG